MSNFENIFFLQLFFVPPPAFFSFLKPPSHIQLKRFWWKNRGQPISYVTCFHSPSRNLIVYAIHAAICILWQLYAFQFPSVKMILGEMCPQFSRLFPASRKHACLWARGIEKHGGVSARGGLLLVGVFGISLLAR